MSDDFDKHDDDFDWLDDDGDDDSESSSSSGLTGELSWLNKNKPFADEGADDQDDLDLDWLQSGDDDSPKTSGNATGVTGELSWLQGKNPAFSDLDQDDDASMDWLPDDDDEDEPETDNADDSDEHPDGLPDWLTDVRTGSLDSDPTSAQLEDDEDELDAGIPNWLRETGEFRRDDILQQLGDEDPDEDEESPADWMDDFVASDEDEGDFEEEEGDWFNNFEETDEDEADPNWLSGIPMGDDDDEDDEIEEFQFDSGISDDDKDEVEFDTDWLNYDDDDEEDEEEEYDPYAIYNDDDFDEEEEEFPDLFGTDSLADDDTDLEDVLFASEEDDDLEAVEGDASDWLAGFEMDEFEEDVEDEPIEEDGEFEADWLDDFDELDEDDFDEEEAVDEPVTNQADWLDGFDADDFEEDPFGASDEDDFSAFTDAEFDEDADPIDDIPDWLKATVQDDEEEEPVIFDEPDTDDGQPARFSTGLTGELSNLDDSDFDFLNELDMLGEDEPSGDGQSARYSTSLTGELSNLDDSDFDFLDDLDMLGEDEPSGDDQSARYSTGLTGELSNLDDSDFDFLDDLDMLGEDEPSSDAQPARYSTGLTGELADLDDSDFDFLDNIEQETADAILSSPDDDDMDLSFLDDDEEAPADWFAEAPTGAVDTEAPDWMQDISDVDINEQSTPFEVASDDMDDVFNVFDDDALELDEAPVTQRGSLDLDEFLATYDDVDASDFELDNSQSGGIEDLDAIFDAALSEQEQDEDLLRDDIPEWLRDVDVMDDETSAAAIIRQHDDKPIEDLDERLQALRERALSSPSIVEETQYATPEVLADVGETLSPARIDHATDDNIASDITLTDIQRQQTQLLQDIVGITLSPSVATDEDGIPMFDTPRRRARPRVGIGRLIVTLLIILMLIVPFVANFGVGSLPPVAFGNDNQDANIVFNEINNLTNGDYVMVGFEYGPTGAGELDSISDILIRHILSKGAKPIIVSSNAIGIVHAQNIMKDIQSSVQAVGLNPQANTDYYITRYLTGGTLGLRDLNQNIGSIVNISVQGLPTNLSLNSLDDLALIVLITERSDDIRNWVEQIIPSTTTRMVAATGYAAQPLAQPYISQSDGIQGLMVGYRDAYTYGQMLDALYATPTPTALPTETATPMPTNTTIPTITPLPTTVVPTIDGEEQAVEPTVDDVTTEATTENTPVATDTPMPTNTVVPTETPLPTNTPTTTPSPTATPNLITVIVVADGNPSVNVRTGPSQNFPVITTAQEGDVFQVIGENEDGDWINFLLPDGREGWIAAFLVDKMELPEADLEEQSEDSADAGQDITVMQASYQRRMGKNQVRYYQQEPTATPDVLAVEPTSDPLTGYTSSRDRRQEEPRLNAITMGTIAAILIILFGNIYFGLRIVIQRRRESK